MTMFATNTTGHFIQQIKALLGIVAINATIASASIWLTNVLFKGI